MPDIFSKEIPELLVEHYNQLIASAISPKVIKERPYRSILDKSELLRLGFKRFQCRVPGILIPLHGPDGSAAGFQYRPDKPRLNEKDKPIKYENIPGEGLRFDVPPGCQVQLANPANELWFVEGCKKGDALVSKGICTVVLTGVWAFKGHGEYQATAVLVDFDMIPWKGRLVYLAFDSDSATNRMVALALERLKEILERKGAIVKNVPMPAGPEGVKWGVDDYLAAGKSLDELRALARDTIEKPEDEYLQLQHTIYRIEQGCVCMVKNMQGVRSLQPLANFIPKIEQEVIFDDGQEERLEFKITGQLAGKPLRQISVPASRFSAMDWIPGAWGAKAVIGAGSSLKDHLRAAIQLMSNGVTPKRLYTHTGWRELDGDKFFLSSAGALGREGIEVSLPEMLANYRLPANPSDIPAREAVRESLAMMDVAKPSVTYPLWAVMFLSPLAELLEPAFTLWLQGRTGSFKSVLSALALCHFGDFTYLNLPASWRDSENHLEKLLFILKDHPLVVDDFPPTPNLAAARELEQKASTILRDQGNKTGRGRLKSDTSFRKKYVPRGMLITSGEQLPSGESDTARALVVNLEKTDVDVAVLTKCQKAASAYKYAMAHYILWLKDNWKHLNEHLKTDKEAARDKATAQGLHSRLPDTVAWLYLGFKAGILFASDVAAIENDQAAEIVEQAWDIFIMLADRQGARVDEERAATRFLDGVGTLFLQGRIFVIPRGRFKAYQDETNPGHVLVGWEDQDGYYLLPSAVYSSCCEFYQRSGGHIRYTSEAIWADLRRLKLLREDLLKDEHNTRTLYIGSGEDHGSPRILPLKKIALEQSEKQERLI